MNPPLGLYVHYKGNEYLLMAVGKIESSLEDVAIYRAAEGDSWWARPLSEFTAEVQVNGKSLPRFRFIGA